MTDTNGNARARAARLIARLKTGGGACVATAESCTGGRLASLLTEVPGASEVFWGGWVTYDNSAKISQLGVSPKLIQDHGAVSPETAQAMAEGGLAGMGRAIACPRGICVATTGIAGPGGGSPQKPVGLCYIALAATGRPTEVLKLRAQAGQSREGYRREFALAALRALEKAVKPDGE